MINPYHNYLKFLIIKNRPLDDILDNIKIQGFVPPNKKLLVNLRKKMGSRHEHLKLRFKSKDTNIARPLVHMEAMDRMMIPEIWTIDPDVRNHIKGTKWEKWQLPMSKASAILKISEARKNIEMLILNRADQEKIAKAIMEQFNFVVDRDTVKLYEKYFWNVKKMSPDDLCSYIRSLQNMTNNPDLVKMSQRSPDWVKWRYGIEEEVELDKILENMLRDAYFKYKEAIEVRDMETSSKAAKAFADIVQKTKELRLSQKELEADMVDTVMQEERVRGLLQDVSLYLEDKVPKSITDLQKELPEGKTDKSSAVPDEAKKPDEEEKEE